MITPLYKYKQTPMTLDQTSLLVSVMEMERYEADFDESKAGLQFAILKGRIEQHKILCNKFVMLFICAMCKTPGELVMYAHALACISQKHAGQEVDTSKLCLAFVNGFPSDSQLEQAWSDQKTEGNNQLDISDNWTPEVLKAAA